VCAQRRSIMRKPNFFIAGAPKCGTTALYQYLRTHPQVYLASPKEPHYFDDDFGNRFRSSTETTYMAKYFAAANGRHKAIGESSPTYLYSEKALPRIRKFNAGARLIVMVRNPVDAAYSLHSQHVYCFMDDEKDFPKAWGLQEERKAGRRVPKACLAPAFLQYKEYVSFGRQLRRAYGCFPQDQVKVIFFDDLKIDPAAVYGEVLRFLDLEPDGRRDFPVVNANRQHRMEWLSKMSYRVPLWAIKMARPVKRLLGIGDISLIERWNRMTQVEVRRPPLAEEIRQEIVAALLPDIELLEELTGRDLSGWKAGGLERSRELVTRKESIVCRVSDRASASVQV
jgi:hypothetical protein